MLLLLLPLVVFFCGDISGIVLVLKYHRLCAYRICTSYAISFVHWGKKVQNAPMIVQLFLGQHMYWLTVKVLQSIKSQIGKLSIRAVDCLFVYHRNYVLQVPKKKNIQTYWLTKSTFAFTINRTMSQHPLRPINNRSRSAKMCVEDKYLIFRNFIY